MLAWEGERHVKTVFQWYSPGCNQIYPLEKQASLKKIPHIVAYSNKGIVCKTKWA
jgi:hypothetical protein